MKKNSIVLLYAISWMNIFVAVNEPITTRLAPLTGDPFIVMVNSNGSSTPSSISFGNAITFGDGTNPIVISENSNVSYPIVWPTSGEFNFLSLNSEGYLVTAVVTQIGTNGNNEISCPVNGNIQITSVDNQDVVVTASGNINFASQQISLMGANEAIATALDANGSLITTNQSLTYYIGDSVDRNYMLIDNNNSSGIQLDTSNTGDNIYLSSGVGNIYLSAGSVVTPSASSMAILAINSNNEIITLDSSSSIICNNLTATGEVLLGNYSSVNNTGNIITVPTTGNLVLKTGISNNIVLDAAGNNSQINLSSASITAPGSGAPNIALALNSANNLVTTNANAVFMLGSNATNKLFITVDNSGSTGIVVNGPTYLKNAGFNLPQVDYTAALTINSNGQLGIVVSSAAYKDNIRDLQISRESFDKLRPTQYNYKTTAKEVIQIGLIAEEVFEQDELKDLVILGQNGMPLSVNYNALSVVVAQQLLEDRKINTASYDALSSEVESLKNMIIILKNELEKIKKA
jgi:hypothetical protein